MTRDEFMDLVYDELHNDGDNNRANRIIDAADSYAEDCESHWIPCIERLPEVRRWVLCQCRAGIMDVLRLTEGGGWNKSYPHAEYMSGFVIAWMPLPESYQGERE